MASQLPTPVRRQIALSYAVVALHFAWLWVPIWVLFYKRFTDYAGVGLLESLSMTMTTVSELPSGMLADRIGKRNTLVIAGFVAAAGGICMGLASSFVGVGAGMLILTLGGAMYLSSMEAFQYDTLKSAGFEHAYPKILSVTTTVRMVSCAGSSILGGLLYQLDPRLPFLGVGLLTFVAAFVAMRLREPAIDTEHVDLGSVRHQLAACVRVLSPREILYPVAVIVAGGMLLTADSSGFWDIQAVTYGLTSEQLGILYTAVYIVMAVVSGGFGRWSRRYGSIAVLGTAAAMFGLCMIVSPVAGAMFGSLLLMLRSVFSVIFDMRASVILNGVIPSRIRATTLSAISTLRGAPYILLAYFLGHTIDASGTAPVAIGQGIGMLIVAVALIPTLRLLPHPKPVRDTVAA